MLARLFLLLCLFSLANCASKKHITLEKSNYSQLQNWPQDKHQEALNAFNKSCHRAKKISTAQIFRQVPKNLIQNEWSKTCKLAKVTKNAKQFFEENFTPYLVKSTKGQRGLFTGYYEIELEGSITKTNKHRHPIYLHSSKVNTKITRSAIEKGALHGKKLEVAYVADKVGLFFMHIQGSGKIRLSDNSYIKLGYAGQNGHPYFAIGNYMTTNNLIDKNTASAESIINWLNANPHKAAKVMNLNESYIYFRVRKELQPVGAMGIEVTPMRTLAVDRSFIPLGMPLWLETTYPKMQKRQTSKPFDRLMIAQDVGGAIKGPIRGDVFFGSNKQAERYAWYMKNMGSYYLLVPNKIAAYLP